MGCGLAIGRFVYTQADLFFAFSKANGHEFSDPRQSFIGSTFDNCPIDTEILEPLLEEMTKLAEFL